MRQLVTILPSIDKLFDAIGNCIGYTLDSNSINQLILDSQQDLVSEKSYQFLSNNRILITGQVDHYEPETVWISFKGLSTKSLKSIDQILKYYAFAFGTGAAFRSERESLSIFNNCISSIN